MSITRKQSELPSGWEMKKLKELGEIISGLTYKPEMIRDNGILVLRSSNVQNRTIAYSDNVHVESNDLKFNPVQEGDILICVRNGSRSLIGKNARIDRYSSGVAFGAFMSVFRSKHNDYLFHVFDTDIYNREIHINLGATINSINSSELKEFKIPLPPLPEQRAIANILSTWDTAIQTTQALISKKEQEKKWLMQNLLTGKKRLKGFSGEWKEYYLSHFIEELKEKPLKSDNYEIFTSAKSGLMKQSDYYSDNRITNREDVDYNLLPSGYITYRSRSDDGLFTFNKNNFPETGLISGYYPVFKSPNGNTEFILEFINYHRRSLTKYAIGTSQLVLSFRALKNAKFIVPEKEEQTAIAEVLQTADKEITLLKTKLEQQKLQKKGLMQVLLTGKVRIK